MTYNIFKYQHYCADYFETVNNGDDETFNNVAQFKQQHLLHCNFQYWYPDEISEANFYTNKVPHGTALSDIRLDRPKEELLSQLFGECNQSPCFKELSAIKYDWWPIILVACRHYRLPVPLQLIRDFNLQNNETR